MKYRATLKSGNTGTLKIVIEQLLNGLKKANCKVSAVVGLPTRIKKFCVIRSPHVNKSSREHFEIRHSKHIIDFELPTKKALQKLLNLSVADGVLISISPLASSVASNEKAGE